jgi:hypothetical protein
VEAVTLESLGQKPDGLTHKSVEADLLDVTIRHLAFAA